MAPMNSRRFPFLLVAAASFAFVSAGRADVCLPAVFSDDMVLQQGMRVPAVTDVGEKDDIHPTKKEPVGERLALAALGIAYHERREYSGPVYRQMDLKGGT